jgi:hypothetical protein
MDSINSENISFFLEDNNKKKEIDLSNLIKEFEQKSIIVNLEHSDSDISHSHLIQYLNQDFNNRLLLSYNINELNKICEYYGLLKNIKIAKYKKLEIINAIIIYENNEDNKNIVEKRIKLWSFLNELLADKVMKKYIIWK